MGGWEGELRGMVRRKWHLVCKTKGLTTASLFLQPERIDPRASSHGYDVRSDVWSLGITLVSEKSTKSRVCCILLACFFSCFLP